MDRETVATSSSLIGEHLPCRESFSQWKYFTFEGETDLPRRPSRFSHPLFPVAQGSECSGFQPNSAMALGYDIWTILTLFPLCIHHTGAGKEVGDFHSLFPTGCEKIIPSKMIQPGAGNSA